VSVSTCYRPFQVDGNALSFSPADDPVERPENSRSAIVPEVTHVASIAIARTRTQTASRRSEAELRQIVDAIPQLIVAMSPGDKILYANEAVLAGESDVRADEQALLPRIGRPCRVLALGSTARLWGSDRRVPST
jgi:hypothetical protein